MKITIGLKIAAAFITLLILLSSMGVITYRGLQSNVSQLYKIEHEVLKQITAGNLRFAVTQVLMAGSDYISTGDAEFISNYKKQNELLNKYFFEFSKLTLEESEKKLLSEIKSEIDSIRFYSEKIFAIEDPAYSSKAINFMRKIDYDYGQEINLKTSAIFDGIAKRINYYRKLGEEIKEDQTESIIKLIAAGILISSVFILLVIYKITHPIKELKNAADKIASGDYSIRPEIKTKDEISALADAFSHMAESISSAHKKISDNNLLLETIFSTIPSGLMVVTEDGKISTANKRMCEIINYDKSSLNHQSIQNVLANIDVSEDCKDFILRKKIIKNYECVSTGFAGEKKYFGLTLLPVELTNKQNLLVADDITDYKHHQERLKELHDLAQSTLDSLTANICVLNESGTIIITNRGWKEFAIQNSADPDRVSNGVNYLEITESASGIDKENALQFLNGIKNVMNSIVDEFKMEYACHSPMQKRWFIGRVTPFAGSNSSPRKVVISHVDITERKISEIALKESEERYRSLFEFSPLGIILEDENGKIVDLNSSTCELTGYTKGELIGKHISLLIPGNDRKKTDEIRNLPLEEKPLQFETVLVKKDGTVIYNQLFETCVTLPNGKKEIISFSNDITLKKKNEMQIKELAEKYTALLETTPDGFWIVDAKGKILDVNDNYCKMSGYTREELLNLSIPELEAKETPEETFEHINQIIKSKADRFETKHKRKDGTIYDVEINTIFWENKKCFIVFVHDISDRKEFEIALNESKEKYRTIADFTYNWECWQAPDGKFLYMSPSCQRITGYSSEEFIKNPELLNKLFHPDDTFKLKDHFMELKNPTGEIHEIEYKIITKSGDLKWISHICQPVYNSQGKYLGRRGSNRDITPQKAADEKILKFSRIVENSPAAIILTNKEGIIEYANKHFKNQFKFKNENEFIGKTPKILQSGNTSKEYYENIWNNLNSGKAWNGIIQNKDKEGGLLWLNVSITPITDSEKNIISYAAIYNDITEQLNLLEELKKYKHQLEEMVAERTKELEKSRETFRALTENSKDVIIRFNRQGKYVYINKAVEQYMNKNVSEIIGKTFYEVGFPLQITELFEKSLNTIFQTKMNCRIEFQLPNGFWFDSLLSPEFDSDGNVTTIISSSRDITEFKKLQLNLQKALDNEKEVNELKDRFISMVSHEFRTPLSSILSSADILEMGGDKLNADRKKTHFIRIKNNIENLTKILDEVVVINKSDLGKFTTSKQNINLETFCSDIFDEFCELYPSIKAEIKFDLNEVHFNLDSAVLRKILSNLLSNAFKYNKTGGSVVFKTEYKDGKIIFEIRDTGMGIPSEEQTNVFEPFFRSSSVQNIKGTGLGLNIVKKLIDQLKGEIYLKSEFNIGTEFIVTIPLNGN